MRSAFSTMWYTLTRQAAKIGVTAVVAGRAEHGFRSFDGCAEVDVVVVERVGASRGCRTTQRHGARNEDATETRSFRESQINAGNMDGTNDGRAYQSCHNQDVSVHPRPKEGQSSYALYLNPHIVPTQHKLGYSPERPTHCTTGTEQVDVRNTTNSRGAYTTLILVLPGTNNLPGQQASSAGWQEPSHPPHRSYIVPSGQSPSRNVASQSSSEGGRCDRSARERAG